MRQKAEYFPPTTALAEEEADMLLAKQQSDIELFYVAEEYVEFDYYYYILKTSETIPIPFLDRVGHYLDRSAVGDVTQ